MEKYKRIVSIVKSKSNRPPKITGPIAEPKTVKALNKLFIEPKNCVPYNSAIIAGWDV